MKKIHPALVCGLTTAACVSAPVIAHAEPLGMDAVEPFLVGFSSGLAVAAMTLAAVAGVQHARDTRAQKRQKSLDQTAQSDIILGLSGEIAITERPSHAKEMQLAKDPGKHLVEARNQGTGPIRIHTNAGDKNTPATHIAQNLEQAAVAYADRETQKERMKTRAQGVAATLFARLSASKMDDLPIIERADGSVGDVGTSWWEASVGADAISKNMGIAEEDPADVIPEDFTSAWALNTEASITAAHTLDSLPSIAEDTPAVESEAVLEPETQAPAEADLEPEVEVTVIESQESTDSDELWDAAIDSLDEKCGGEAEAHQPTEGLTIISSHAEADDSTPTGFIPFKVPAGHTEVTDTESYIDYLIREEFEKAKSRVVRRSSRRYLRMVEGGTSSFLPQDESQPLYIGKHFAQNIEVEERLQA